MLRDALLLVLPACQALRRSPAPVISRRTFASGVAIAAPLAVVAPASAAPAVSAFCPKQSPAWKGCTLLLPALPPLPLENTPHRQRQKDAAAAAAVARAAEQDALAFRLRLKELKRLAARFRDHRILLHLLHDGNNDNKKKELKIKLT